MNFRSTVFYICLIVSTGCLSAGYVLAGYLVIIPVLLTMLLLWAFAKRGVVSWLASSLFLGYIIFSAIGVIVNLPVVLMIIACTFALVSWDLIQFEQGMTEQPMRKTRASLEKYHLPSLTLAAFTGLLFAFMSTYIHLQLSYGVIVFLVLIAVGGLTLGMQHIGGKKQ